MKTNNGNSGSYTKRKPQATKKVIKFYPGLTVGGLASELGIPAAYLIKKFIDVGTMVNINHKLTEEEAQFMVTNEGYIFEIEQYDGSSIFDDFDDDESLLSPRAPIITVMGHVDHGKTTLLDVIRKTKVVEGEAGGITQHIGAYQIVRNNKKLTFIDTPGHAAFSEMRAKGAKVTDIVILVVAADDGVMPQTLESIAHAKAAKVPIIVAVNKIDKNNANPDQVMSELANQGLIPDTWGGKTPFVMISALRQKGIDELLDYVDLVSEELALKANPNKFAFGYVIEASLDKGRGPVATLIVKNGSLKISDYVVVGGSFGRIRSMNDDSGAKITVALPGTPVEITGLSKVPEPGVKFKSVEDEKTAKDISSRNKIEVKGGDSLDEVNTYEKLLTNADNQTKTLNVIIKADVVGTIPALRTLLSKIKVEDFIINVVYAAVGGITDNDITLAQTSKAFLIAFNVRISSANKQLAQSKGVVVRPYDIIYRVSEDIEDLLKGKMKKEYESIVIGSCVVRQIFKVAKIGTIAGCYVTEGIIKRDTNAKVFRNDIPVYDGKLASLRRGKDDVKEVRTGFECGLSFVDFNDIKEGDIIEITELREVLK
jgi:translation initiation factor IF-2